MCFITPCVKSCISVHNISFLHQSHRNVWRNYSIHILNIICKVFLWSGPCMPYIICNPSHTTHQSPFHFKQSWLLSWLEAGTTVCSLLLSTKVLLVEGPSGDLIPKMKEQYGITTFDLVFLDHWKDRYLPDTRLLEARGFVFASVHHLIDVTWPTF